MPIIIQTKKLVSEQNTVPPNTNTTIANANRQDPRIILASICNVNYIGYCNFDKFLFIFKLLVELYYSDIISCFFFAYIIVELFNKNESSFMS